MDGGRRRVWERESCERWSLLRVLASGKGATLRLLPAPTTISLASVAVAVRPRLQRSVLLQALISSPDHSLQNGAASPLNGAALEPHRVACSAVAAL